MKCNTYRFIKLGALVQMYISSIEGVDGKPVKKAALQMLKHYMVHFVGTDTHSIKKRQSNVKAATEKLKANYPDQAYSLLCDNPRRIINNEYVKITEPIKIVQ